VISYFNISAALGIHQSTPFGITIDLEKIEAIRGFPTQRNVSKVTSFMGLTSYYRRFIKDSQRLQSQSLLCKRKE
jgi:hypothetical protein